MIKCKSFGSALLLLGLFLVWCILPIRADDSTQQRFAAEYPREAKLLKDLWDQCSGSYQLIPIGKSSRKEPYSVRFSRSHGFEKFELDNVRNTQDGQIQTNTVFCAGDDGTFFAISKASSNPKYRVGYIKPNEMDRLIYESDFARCIRAPLGGYQHPLITMIEDRSASIVDANPVAGNSQIIEAKFAMTKDSPLKFIVARFDTANHWAVVDQSYHVGNPPELQASYHVDYGMKHDGIAFPTRFSASEEREQYHFGEWKFQESPRMAFSLPHYGLPDLIKASRSQRKAYTFRSRLIIGTCISCLLGLGLLWLSKRSRKVKMS